MSIDNLTYKELKEIADIFSGNNNNNNQHPSLGKRCLVRTYSAGVHIGDVVWINHSNAMECKLENALRLWEWSDGGLSLSAVANNGIKKGRLNRTGKVSLTNAIEYIETTQEAEESYVRFIED